MEEKIIKTMSGQEKVSELKKETVDPPKNRGVSSKQEMIRNYMNLAREFRDLGLLDKAEATYLMALEKVPNHPFLMTGLANLYIKMRLYQKAGTILRRIIKRHPEQKLPYFMLGKVLQMQHKSKQAIQYYKKALRNNKNDLFVLYKLIPLLIEYRRAGEALELVRQYEDMIADQKILQEWEGMALAGLGETDAALCIFESILEKDPVNRRVLSRLMRVVLDHKTDHPVHYYKKLKKKIPSLTPLVEDDLLTYEIEFFIRHKKYDKALDLLDVLLKKEPENFYWQKRRAFLLKEMGKESESFELLKELFLTDPDDIYVRQALEKIFTERKRLREWKALLRETLRLHPQYPELFGYIRRISHRIDWLMSCPWDYAEFILRVEELPTFVMNFHDDTFRKLPFYALESFTMLINFEQKIPTPEFLLEYIARQRSGKKMNFQLRLDDLMAAYPFWLFGMQFYFLFKSYTDFDAAFIPVYFQRELIATRIDIPSRRIDVDISLFTIDKETRLKEFVKEGKNLRWRWPVHPAPKIIKIGIPFYSPEQFKAIINTRKPNLD